jgi:hypothetical protein
MNGCLFKTLLIMAALVALLVFYPYLTKYTRDSMQEKISNLETKGTIAKKIVKIIYNNQSKETPKNDNTKNKETGE